MRGANCREAVSLEGKAAMLNAAVKALSQLLSPPMRSILWRSIGLSLVLIVVLAIGLQRLLSWFAVSGADRAWAMLPSHFYNLHNHLTSISPLSLINSVSYIQVH